MGSVRARKKFVPISGGVRIEPRNEGNIMQAAVVPDVGTQPATPRHAKFKPFVNPGTPYLHNKIPRRCDIQKQYRSDDHKRERRQGF